MDNNLQHEDLLIKLRAKLNEEKVKLWEAPYITPENEITQDFKVRKYSILDVFVDVGFCVIFVFSLRYNVMVLMNHRTRISKFSYLSEAFCVQAPYYKYLVMISS